MRRFNVFAPDFTYAEGRPDGYRAGSARIGPAIGGDKIGTWPDGETDILIVRRESAVDYWDGER